MKKENPLPLSAAALRAVERRGVSRYGLRDLYHTLMTVPLWALIMGLAGAFFAVNLVFGVVYLATGGLAGATRGTFGDAFFFSVQTLSTTGYGAIYPASSIANIVCTFEILLGLLGTALATGVLFARLSRPRARVLFSEVMVIRDIKGVPVLMFRLVNERRNQISEARMSVVMTRDERDEEGGTLRRLVPLKLERDVTPVFALSWVVMHRITPESPLYGVDPEAMRQGGNVMVCAMTGIDDTLNAQIYARHVYGAENVRFGHRFVDVVTRNEAGDMVIDYSRFHDTIKI